MTTPYSLILIDGSSYFYRAFHALPPLANSKGMPTGAMYGVVNMIRRLLKDYPTDYVGVVFDTKGKTFRDDLYPEYKAHRPPMPDELSSQFQPMVELIEALGLPIIMQSGVEADDVIGTLAHQATARGLSTLISTGDKDMAQLVNPQVHLINTMSNKLMDIEGVKGKFGIGPELIIDYLTLIGDTVDNIPGVHKVGPKTAVKWLEQFGNLDSIMENADQVTGKVGENLRESLSYLPLSKTLVTIKTDVSLPIDILELTRKAPNQEKLIELYREYEFKTWLNEILSNHSTAPAKPKQGPQYQTILTEAVFNEWLERLRTSTLMTIDTETTDLNAINAEIVGISIALKPHEAAYIPLAHDYPEAPVQLSREFVLGALKPLLEDPRHLKIGQNLKYDCSVLANYGITVRGIAYDTMLESYVLNSGANRHDMDSLSLKYLGHKTITFEEVAGKGVKQLPFNQILLEAAAEYAAEDADITCQLHEKMYPLIQQEPGTERVFREIEIPLIPVLSKIERQGVLIDQEKLFAQGKSLAIQIERLEKEAFAMAGTEFNMNSPKQLQSLLFETLGLPILQKTPTGQPSTAENVLSELAYDYPLPKVILEYRSLTKLKSTYIDALPRQINPKTGRVHTSYNQAVTATGRLSSTEPNLQNIPVRTEEGRRIREAFIAPPGFVLVAADYSQIELRIMAHISGDAGLCHAFNHGKDIHSATAAEVFGVPFDQVTSEQRRRSKAINFGLIYGMSAFGLAKQIDVSREAAQDYINLYFARYPGVKEYMDTIRQQAHQTGYVETLFGRRLYLPEINARNLQRQRAAERAAINAPMQGTAADIIKIAMINIDQWLANQPSEAKLLMQVHDELVFEVPEHQVNQLIPEINRLMSHAVELKVPVIVDIGYGKNWEQAH